MDDGELERMLRAANPARTPKDAKPNHALMNRIMADQPERSAARVRSRFALFVTPVAAVLLATLALVITNPFAQAPAAAYGPPPLRWTPTQQTLAEVVLMTQERLTQSIGPQSALRQSRATSWSLTVDEAGEADQVTTISPLVTELVWHEDLSGERIVTAGAPYPVVGSSLSSDATPQGTLIDEMEFAPGTFPVLAPNAGSLDAEGFRQLLSAYAPPGAQAGDAMLGIVDVLGEWTLTNAQHGYLVEALLQYDGLTVLGTTTDRLGREVVGLRSAASARPGETTTMLLSSATGRIVGVETTVTGEEASAPVPVGTVIHYALWEDKE